MEPEKIVQAANSLDLSEVKLESLKAKSVPDMFKNKMDDLLMEYRRFLALKVVFFDTQSITNLSPSKILLLVWQIHYQMPNNYAECCQELGVKIIEIDSSVSNNSLKFQRGKLKTTRSRYEILFRNVPPKMFWEDSKDTFSTTNAKKMDTVTHIKIKTVADINANLVDLKPDVKIYIGPEIGHRDPFKDIKAESVADSKTESVTKIKVEPVSDLIQVKKEYIEIEQPNKVCSETKTMLQESNDGIYPYPPLDNFADAGLNPILEKNLKRCGYSDPTPIQKRCLPIIMAGRDLEACSPSGSGKTAAYLLPIIDKLLESGADSYKDAVIATPQCIVVVSTQGLALRVKNEVNKLAFGSEIKSCVLYGGESEEFQLEHLSKGCNILIATPQKLLESVDKAWVGSWVSFENLRFLVFDETQHLLPRIGNQPHPSMPVKENRQTLVFLTRFAHAWSLKSRGMILLNNQVSVMIGAVDGAFSFVDKNFYAVCGLEQKLQKLFEILQENNNKENILIFAANKKKVEKIIFCLTNKGFSSEWIHKDRSEKKKEDALHDFYRGEVHTLVSTFNTSFGPDIKDVAHVINFDMPRIEYRMGKLLDGVGSAKKVSTFFDACKDYPLAGKLIMMMGERDMDVPDWLASVRSNQYTANTCSCTETQVSTTNDNSQTLAKHQSHRGDVSLTQSAVVMNPDSVEVATPVVRINESAAPRKVAVVFSCDLCGINTSSNDNLKMHFLGAKHMHKKKLMASTTNRIDNRGMKDKKHPNTEGSTATEFDYNSNESVSNQEVMPGLAVTTCSSEKIVVVNEAIKEANEFWQCLTRKWEGESTGQDVLDFPFKYAKIE